MPREIRTKRWNDPRAADDGVRVLVTRYRPRGLPKSGETWDRWLPDAGPSKELHAAFYGKSGPPIGWAEYERRYLEEMAARPVVLDKLRRAAPASSNLTLLCSSACEDEARCHRTLLKRLLEG